MTVVGLTGGIGSGKTTVGNFFKALQVPVYIADDEAKKLMHTAALRQSVIKLLGEQAYKQGHLDRSYIADQVFNNTDLLQKLNAIVHPAVAQHFENWCAQQKSAYVLKEAAILFENDSYKKNTYNILITAPERVRIQRVIQRDDTTVQKVKARIGQQWSDERKMKLADFLITNIDRETTEKEVRKIHVKIMGSLVNS